MGFSSPAASYEKYNRLSGPLTRKVTVNGEQRPYFYAVPRLEDARQQWDDVHGPREWPQVQEELPPAPDEEPF